jgi:uncharacterized protein YwgA
MSNLDSNRMAAVLGELIECLGKRGSWTGETHIQKAAYLLSALLGVNLGFEFVLYKYGPYSFELHGELGSLLTDGLVELQFPDPRYGGRFHLTSHGEEFRRRFPRTVGEYDNQIRILADHVGAKNVAQLERLATAVFLKQEFPNEDRERWARRLTEVKPHIPIEEAYLAVQEAEALEAALRNEFS